MIGKKIQKLDFQEFVQLGIQLFEKKKYKETISHFSNELRNIQANAEFLCLEIRNLLFQVFQDSEFQIKNEKVIECLTFCLQKVTDEKKLTILLKYLFLNLKCVKWNDEMKRKLILKEIIKLLENGGKQSNPQIMELCLIILYDLNTIKEREEIYHLLSEIFNSSLFHYEIKNRNQTSSHL
jgi:hypothetical protein